jgi:hypothetical protein
MFGFYKSGEYLDHLRTVKCLSKTSTTIVNYWLKKRNVLRGVLHEFLRQRENYWYLWYICSMQKKARAMNKQTPINY